MNDDRNYGLDALHGDLLELMCFIHNYCERRGIKYSLTGGSLLGAIRHNGFIPWDDDFDIMFDRSNYERFIDSMRNENNAEYILEQDQWVYRIRKHHKTKGFVPSIDLFVMDRVPRNRIVYKAQIICLKILQGMLRENEIKRKYSTFYTFCIKATSLAGKPFNKRKLFSVYDKVSQIGNCYGGSKTAIFDDKFKLISFQYNDNLMDSYELHRFEDKEFYIISRYKDYLVKQYGDYMTLPPISERIPMHSI